MPVLKGFAVLQARNNARVVVSGSIAMFSNQFYGATVAADGAEGCEACCQLLGNACSGCQHDAKHAPYAASSIVGFEVLAQGDSTCATVQLLCRPQRAGNREFASAVASWAFSQRGVLRASPLRHGLSGVQLSLA